MRQGRRVAVLIGLCVLLVAGGVAASAAVTPTSAAHLTCSSGYVSAIIGGESKCLHAGEFCSSGSESDYERYGFKCVDGRLEGSGGSSTPPSSTPTTTTDSLAPHCSVTVGVGYGPGLANFFPFAYSYLGTLTTETLNFGDGSDQAVTAGQVEVDHKYAANGTYQASLSCADSTGRSASQTVSVSITSAPATVTISPITTSETAPATALGITRLGRTIAIRRRTQTSHCTRGALPDRQCSPGAFYSGLTKAVLCSSSFHTGTVRNVPESEKHQVETEYGMPAKSYGRTIEIDHIVSLELGGSNDISNLFPEPGSGRASYHVKDKLENKLHAMVCDGAISLRAAQRGIASNWETLYEKAFGANP